MPNRRVHVDEIKGDAVFVVAVEDPPQIPAEEGRDCPQCKRLAWRRSRWCWHCDFDFDRAAIPWLHPAKARLLALVLLFAIAVSTGWIAMHAHLNTPTG